jgi:uncharacterized membrane protein YfcA
MNLATAFADISLAQLVLIAAVAVLASIVGGVAGYGTGALMPLVLVPIVGAEPVVPIIALSSLLTNSSRAIVFLPQVDFRRALIVLLFAIPTCIVGAYGYSLLTGKGAQIVIGTMMLLSVPLRRLARKRGYTLSDKGLAVSSVGWGVVVGGTSGAGIILLSMLMAAGVQGAAVIATDAAISIAIGIVKIAVFGVTGIMTAKVIAVALLIGLVAFPGAFIAKRLVEKLSLAAHTAILDAVVMFGGAAMLFGALAA